MMFSVVLAFAYLSTASGIRSTSKQGLHPNLFTTKGGGNGMPKIIHQTWKTNQLPGLFKNWSESWKACLPDWEYRFYTDDDNRAYIAKHFPALLEQYDRFGGEEDPSVDNAAIRKVDMAKYAYLAAEGGLYVDMDMECMKDPTPIFEKMNNGGASHFFVREDDTKGANEFWAVSTSMMGTDGPSRFFEKAVERLESRSSSEGPVADTGVVYFTELAALTGGVTTDMWSENETETIVQHGRSAVLLGHEAQFNGPRYYDLVKKRKCVNRERCLKLFPNAYSISHWTDVWHGAKVPE
jgi:hypothetical protein